MPRFAICATLLAAAALVCHCGGDTTHDRAVDVTQDRDGGMPDAGTAVCVGGRRVGNRRRIIDTGGTDSGSPDVAGTAARSTRDRCATMAGACSARARPRWRGRRAAAAGCATGLDDHGQRQHVTLSTIKLLYEAVRFEPPAPGAESTASRAWTGVPQGAPDARLGGGALPRLWLQRLRLLAPGIRTGPESAVRGMPEMASG